MQTYRYPVIETCSVLEKQRTGFHAIKIVFNMYVSMDFGSGAAIAGGYAVIGAGAAL
jgi:hypothetical protein